MAKNPPSGAVGRDPHWAAKMDRLRKRAPMTRSITFADDDAAQAVLDAKTGVNRARRLASAEIRRDLAEGEVLTDDAIDAHPDVKAANKAEAKALRAQEQLDVTVVVRGLPADVYEALQGEYPPTGKQADAGQTYNVTRFAPALISACHVDGMSVEDAARLVGGEYPEIDDDGNETGEWIATSATLTQGEASALYNLTVNVNQNARGSLGKG